MIDWGAHFLKEPKEREVYLSPDEASQLAEILPHHIAIAFSWSLYTGCRLDETTKLTWECIDIDRCFATVETKARGEHIVHRKVWLSEKALRVLETLESRKGKVFDLRNRRKHWEKARSKIGRPDIHWHDLRAMTATWSRQFAGKDLRLIGRALGHSDEATTARYAHVIDYEVIEMLNQLPDIEKPLLAPEQKQLSILLSKHEKAEGMKTQKARKSKS
jgi:integrase